MLITKLHKTYAKSLLEFAIEMDKLEEVREDVMLVLAVGDESRDFGVMLKSPVINPGKKEKVIDAIFGGKFTEITTHFIRILIRKGREPLLEEIMHAFLDRYRDHKGIEKALVTTATGLSDGQRAEVEKILTEFTKSSVEIEEKVNADLIGGLIVKVGDHQYNGSIARKLEKLRMDFNKNSFIANF
ncbi:MAG: ATP synthase F1 subunit delta [Owenweeksia sp.]|nr:ATP synthase F1 subunit delta [Owenweeksia sp.]